MDKRGKKSKIFSTPILTQNRRGQVAIFIIIAIVIISGVVVYFTFSQKTQTTSRDRQIYQINPEGVREAVQDCLEQISKPSVYYVALLGGYYDVPENANSLGIPYYYYEGKSYVPETSTIENEISKAVKIGLENCVNNFENFEELDIRAGEPEINSEILNDSVAIKTKYPITISQDGTSSQLEDFSDVEVPVRLGIIYEAAKEIVEKNLELETNEVCLSCIADISLEKDIYTNTLRREDNTNIFIISDNRSNNNFKFIFAGK